MVTFASLFSGGGGADLGAIAAGLDHLWGIELDPDVANVYRENVGECFNYDLLECDAIGKLESPDWLHASPPCQSFSTANANKGEKARDIKLGQKVAEFIRVLKPKYFSLENVRAYRDSRAFKAIVTALNKQGYHCSSKVVDAANYGVPQSRKRLFLIAYRGDFRWGFTPFTGHSRQVGWYEAIADLVHDLPDSQLAEWQIKALPDEFKSRIVPPGNIGSCQSSPSSVKPCFTLTASNSVGTKALLIENTGARSDRPLQTREPNEPSWTIRAMGQDGHWHRSTALDRGRVVQLDIRCLARLQSFPDSYKFPERKSLAGKIIGNSVPPLLMQKLIEATL